jgi:hypothetical protein
MRILERRLKKLEVGHIDAARQEDPDRRIVDLLRERRRRRLEASGLPFEERPRRSEVPASSPRLSAAETLRRCGQYRVEQRIKEEREEIGPKHLQAS